MILYMLRKCRKNECANIGRERLIPNQRLPAHLPPQVFSAVPMVGLRSCFECME